MLIFTIPFRFPLFFPKKKEGQNEENKIKCQRQNLKINEIIGKRFNVKQMKEEKKILNVAKISNSTHSKRKTNSEQMQKQERF